MVTAVAPSRARFETPFALDVIAGLTATPKRLPPKYLYDEAGCRLFERITEQPEYYPTRTELEILEDKAAAIAAFVPPGATLVEFGTGTSTKARILLRAAPSVRAYVPVDLAAESLEREAEGVRQDFAGVSVVPVVADFMRPFALPATVGGTRCVGFFPGSTIGNFEPHEATTFLEEAGTILGAGATLIVGVDLVKDARVLNAAYNDAAGVTAKFNLNYLARINRELGAGFKVECFEHHAFFNAKRSRIEMHLASMRRQKIRIDGETVDFRMGETIHTENSYKYTLSSFGALARGAGWKPAAVWTDPKGLFSVHALRLESAAPLP